MRKIKDKPIKTPKVPRGQTVILISDSLTYYRIAQEQYDKHCMRQLGKRIFAALRGLTIEDDDHD